MASERQAVQFKKQKSVDCPHLILRKLTSVVHIGFRGGSHWITSLLVALNRYGVECGLEAISKRINVVNCQVTLEFAMNDDSSVNLSEMRFHIPPAGEDDDPAEAFK